MPRTRRAVTALAPLTALLLNAACGGGDASEEAAPEARSRSTLVQRLADGQAVFGAFAGEPTAEQGARDATDDTVDFYLYSLERGPFDLQPLTTYLEGMRQGAGDDVLSRRPVLLRIPPIGDDRAAAGARVSAALEAGVGGIVFPHVTSPDQARASVRMMGDGLWPADPAGARVDVLIIEDREGVERADSIVATPGLSVVFAGPGDLRRAYDGDMEAVEGAIQRVLAACLAHGVACGVTAGVDDIARRLDEGFRVIIVTEREALSVGREAAGR